MGSIVPVSRAGNGLLVYWTVFLLRTFLVAPNLVNKMYYIVKCRQNDLKKAVLRKRAFFEEGGLLTSKKTNSFFIFFAVDLLKLTCVLSELQGRDSNF